MIFITKSKLGVYDAKLGERIRNALSPDLLKPGYGGSNPMMGHCYVASEAYYYLMGGPNSGLKPKRARTGDVVHWWLEDTDGTVIDLTHDQFSQPIDYSQGKGGGFLTAQPSKRAQALISRVVPQKTSGAILDGFGYFDGQLYIADYHHADIIMRLIEDKGYTFSDLMTMPSAFGWLRHHETKEDLAGALSAGKPLDEILVYFTTGTSLEGKIVPFELKQQAIAAISEHYGLPAVQANSMSLWGWNVGAELPMNSPNYKYFDESGKRSQKSQSDNWAQALYKFIYNDTKDTLYAWGGSENELGLHHMPMAQDLGRINDSLWFGSWDNNQIVIYDYEVAPEILNKIQGLVAARVGTTLPIKDWNEWHESRMYKEAKIKVEYVDGHGYIYDLTRLPWAWDNKSKTLYITDWGEFHKPILQHLQTGVSHAVDLPEAFTSLIMGTIDIDGWVDVVSGSYDVTPEDWAEIEKYLGELANEEKEQWYVRSEDIAREDELTEQVKKQFPELSIEPARLAILRYDSSIGHDQFNINQRFSAITAPIIKWVDTSTALPHGGGQPYIWDSTANVVYIATTDTSHDALMRAANKQHGSKLAWSYEMPLFPGRYDAELGKPTYEALWSDLPPVVQEVIEGSMIHQKSAALKDLTEDFKDVQDEVPGEGAGWISQKLFKFIYNPTNDTLYYWGVTDSDGLPSHNLVLESLVSPEEYVVADKQWAFGYGSEAMSHVYQSYGSPETRARAKELVEQLRLELSKTAGIVPIPVDEDSDEAYLATNDPDRVAGRVIPEHRLFFLYPGPNHPRTNEIAEALEKRFSSKTSSAKISWLDGEPTSLPREIKGVSNPRTNEVILWDDPYKHHIGTAIDVGWIKHTDYLDWMKAKLGYYYWNTETGPISYSGFPTAEVQAYLSSLHKTSALKRFDVSWPPGGWSLASTFIYDPTTGFLALEPPADKYAPIIHWDLLNKYFKGGDDPANVDDLDAFQHLVFGHIYSKGNQLGYAVYSDAYESTEPEPPELKEELENRLREQGRLARSKTNYRVVEPDMPDNDQYPGRPFLTMDDGLIILGPWGGYHDSLFDWAVNNGYEPDAISYVLSGIVEADGQVSFYYEPNAKVEDALYDYMQQRSGHNRPDMAGSYSGNHYEARCEECSGGTKRGARGLPPRSRTVSQDFTPESPISLTDTPQYSIKWLDGQPQGRHSNLTVKGISNPDTHEVYLWSDPDQHHFEVTEALHWRFSETGFFIWSNLFSEMEWSQGWNEGWNGFPTEQVRAYLSNLYSKQSQEAALLTPLASKGVTPTKVRVPEGTPCHRREEPLPSDTFYKNSDINTPNAGLPNHSVYLSDRGAESEIPNSPPEITWYPEQPEILPYLLKGIYNPETNQMVLFDGSNQHHWDIATHLWGGDATILDLLPFLETIGALIAVRQEDESYSVAYSVKFPQAIFKTYIGNLESHNKETRLSDQVRSDIQSITRYTRDYYGWGSTGDIISDTLPEVVSEVTYHYLYQWDDKDYDATVFAKVASQMIELEGTPGGYYKWIYDVEEDAFYYWPVGWDQDGHPFHREQFEKIYGIEDWNTVSHSPFVVGWKNGSADDQDPMDYSGNPNAVKKALGLASQIPIDKFSWKVEDPTKIQVTDEPTQTGFIPFGWIDGNWFFSKGGHHSAILYYLIDKGYTWDQLENSLQLWGWATLNEPSLRDKQLHLTFFTDAARNDEQNIPEAIQSLRDKGWTITVDDSALMGDPKGKDYGDRAKKIYGTSSINWHEITREDLLDRGFIGEDWPADREWKAIIRDDSEGWYWQDYYGGEPHHMDIIANYLRLDYDDTGNYPEGLIVGWSDGGDWFVYPDSEENLMLMSTMPLIQKTTSSLPTIKDVATGELGPPAGWQNRRRAMIYLESTNTIYLGSPGNHHGPLFDKIPMEFDPNNYKAGYVVDNPEDKEYGFTFFNKPSPEIVQALKQAYPDYPILYYGAVYPPKTQISKLAKWVFFSYVYVGEPIKKLFITGEDYHYALVNSYNEIVSEYQKYPQTWGRVDVKGNSYEIDFMSDWLGSGNLQEGVIRDYSPNEDTTITIDTNLREDARKAIEDWMQKNYFVSDKPRTAAKFTVYTVNTFGGQLIDKSPVIADLTNNRIWIAPNAGYAKHQRIYNFIYGNGQEFPEKEAHGYYKPNGSFEWYDYYKTPDEREENMIRTAIESALGLSTTGAKLIALPGWDRVPWIAVGNNIYFGPRGTHHIGIARELYNQGFINMNDSLNKYKYGEINNGISKSLGWKSKQDANSQRAQDLYDSGEWRNYILSDYDDLEKDSAVDYPTNIKWVEMESSHGGGLPFIWEDNTLYIGREEGFHNDLPSRWDEIKVIGRILDDGTVWIYQTEDVDSYDINNLLKFLSANISRSDFNNPSTRLEDSEIGHEMADEEEEEEFFKQYHIKLSWIELKEWPDVDIRTWKSFGYVNGSLYIEDAHHLDLMQRLLSQMGMEALMNAKQAWGWLYIDEDDDWYAPYEIWIRFYTDQARTDEEVKKDALDALQKKYAEIELQVLPSVYQPSTYAPGIPKMPDIKVGDEIYWYGDEWIVHSITSKSVLLENQKKEVYEMDIPSFSLGLETGDIEKLSKVIHDYGYPIDPDSDRALLGRPIVYVPQEGNLYIGAAGTHHDDLIDELNQRGFTWDQIGEFSYGELANWELEAHPFAGGELTDQPEAIVLYGEWPEEAIEELKNYYDLPMESGGKRIANALSY